MVFPFGSRESADDVRNEYKRRVNQFFNEIEGPRHVLTRRKSFDDLIAWGRNIHGEHRRVSNELAVSTADLQAAQAEVAQLRQAVSAGQRQLMESTTAQANLIMAHDRELARIRAEQTRAATAHHNELTRLKEECDRKVLALETSHEKEVQGLRQEHILTVEKLTRAHESRLADIAFERALEAEKWTDERSKLVAQLLVNQDDNRAWTDDVLKVRFGSLQRLIESVTAPRHKEFRLPSGKEFGPDLDPTCFVARAGRGKAHLLLKSLVWAILVEQFFSAPYGFGVVGPGGSRELLDLHDRWRRMFDGTMRAVAGETMYAIFQGNMAANNWRSATFQCIQQASTDTPMNSYGGSLGNGDMDYDDDDNDDRYGSWNHPKEPTKKQSAAYASPGAPPIATAIEANVTRTIERVLALLGRIAAMNAASGEEPMALAPSADQLASLVPPDVASDVRSLVGLARDLAVQFGVHTALLSLEMPRRGSQVEVGDDVHDCQDGDEFKGKKCTVDLVVLPGLTRVGDGSARDMVTRRTLVPCEIYALEDASS